MERLPFEEVLAAVQAVRAGDLPALKELLARYPSLATARLPGPRGGERTLLHVATDWPGHFPNGVTVVTLLVSAGADPNARTAGRGQPETPLHWAASSDDAEVAAALIDGGADLEVEGGSIARGTPLDNAVGYGQWMVARLLVDRGARVRGIWQAAALGIMPRLEAFFSEASPPPSAEDVNHAFWQACAGGQRRTAEYLLLRGADPTWVPEYSPKHALEIAGAIDGRRQVFVEWLTERLAERP